MKRFFKIVFIKGGMNFFLNLNIIRVFLLNKFFESRVLIFVFKYKIIIVYIEFFVLFCLLNLVV